MPRKTSRIRSLTLVVPLVAAIAVTTAAPAARASEIGQGRDFGIGLILGYPTGLTGKYYFNNDHALDFAVGGAWFAGWSLYIHADYLYHFQLLSHSSFDLPLYIGVGPKIILWFYDHDHHYLGGDSHGGHFGIGVRVPVGIAFELNSVPLDIFLEIVPGVGFYPGIGAFIDGAIGVRYWF